MATVTNPPADTLVLESLNDGDKLYEVVDGQIVEKIMGASESEIASILDQLLGSFVRLNRLGKVLMETMFRIDLARNLQRRPDLAFVSHERWPFQRRIPQGAAWDMVPDLAVEVVSPSNPAVEVHKKIHEYFRAGVRRVWIVYPETREVYVYESPKTIQVLQLEDELDGAPLLPGFRLALKTLFEDEPE